MTVEITVTFSEDSLFDDAPGYDVDAIKNEYARMVEKTILSEFDNVEVVVQESIDDKIKIDADSAEELIGFPQSELEKVLEDVYMSFDWVVLT